MVLFITLYIHFLYNIIYTTYLKKEIQLFDLKVKETLIFQK